MRFHSDFFTKINTVIIRNHFGLTRYVVFTRYPPTFNLAILEGGWIKNPLELRYPIHIHGIWPEILQNWYSIDKYEDI